MADEQQPAEPTSPISPPITQATAPGDAGYEINYVNHLLPWALNVTTKMAANVVAGYLGRGSWEPLAILKGTARSNEEKVVEQQTLEQQKTELFKHLAEHDIDPMLFDSILSNEVNRLLKIRFGITFLALTTFFTGASYAVVVLNGIFKWGVSNAAITGLIIETPLQFVGLLYIIARNLFPQANTGSNQSYTKPTTRKKPATRKKPTAEAETE